MGKLTAEGRPGVGLAKEGLSFVKVEGGFREGTQVGASRACRRNQVKSSLTAA